MNAPISKGVLVEREISCKSTRENKAVSGQCILGRISAVLWGNKKDIACVFV